MRIKVYFSGGFCIKVRVVLSAFLSLSKKPSDTECHLKAWALLLSSFYQRGSLLSLPSLPVIGAPFKRTSLHFKRPWLPLPFPRLPRRRTRTQLSAAQILYIPWPSLPPLPELTPPQHWAVEKMIFYACHSSPHTDTAYERHTEPTSLPFRHVCVHAYLCTACFYMLY